MGGLDAVWSSLDDVVASGWAPGCVAAVRHAGRVETYAAGTLAAGGDRPVRDDTLFRIASLTKPVCGTVVVSLVADGVLRLDDPVARWLPELAEPRVLARPGGPLDDTVAAVRPITVRHLLTMTFGLGVLLDPCPLAAAMQDAGLGAAPNPPRRSADAFMAAVGALPLAYQPGDSWLYHTASDVLGVLVARATGRTPGELVAERVTGPLGLTATGFTAVDVTRLATAYRPVPGGLAVADPPDGVFAAPPPFEAFGSGLVSTAPEYLRFLAALADGRLLPPDLLAAMTSDRLDDTQRPFLERLAGPGRSYGLQVGVDTARTAPWMSPGRYGWTGGSGTSAFVDPERDLIGVVFTQRAMTRGDEAFEYFWGPLATVR